MNDSKPFNSNNGTKTYTKHIEVVDQHTIEPVKQSYTNETPSET